MTLLEKFIEYKHDIFQNFIEYKHGFFKMFKFSSKKSLSYKLKGKNIFWIQTKVPTDEKRVIYSKIIKAHFIPEQFVVLLECRYMIFYKYMKLISIEDAEFIISEQYQNFKKLKQYQKWNKNLPDIKTLIKGSED